MTTRGVAPLALAWAALWALTTGPLTHTQLLAAAAGWAVLDAAAWRWKRPHVHRIDIPGGYITASGCDRAEAQRVAAVLAAAKKRGNL